VVTHSLLLLPSPALPSTRSIWQAEAFVIAQPPTTLSCFCHAHSSPFVPIHTITSSIEPALTQDHEDKQQSPFPSPSLFTGNHITFPVGAPAFILPRNRANRLRPLLIASPHHVTDLLPRPIYISLHTSWIPWKHIARRLSSQNRGGVGGKI